MSHRIVDILFIVASRANDVLMNIIRKNIAEKGIKCV
jgi:hypothetical protein